MIICIIITVLLLGLCIFATADYLKDDTSSSDDVVSGLFMSFIITLIVTIGLSVNAAENKAIYNNMASNPQCYSINDLKNAHRAIQGHKSHQGHWTSFYNGYEFPEINVNVMDEVDNTVHFIK